MNSNNKQEANLLQEPSSSVPVIRRRCPVSRRRRDGLLRFAKDRTSQNGEDGIIERLFCLLPPPADGTYWCVDVGAWDGKHLSNTYSLLVSSEKEEQQEQRQNWRGVLIEANVERFRELQALHEPLGNICLNMSVSGMADSPHNLVNILSNNRQVATKVDVLDFISIDIDGSDYWILHGLLTAAPSAAGQRFRPRVICIEFNPTMPDDLIYIPARNDSIRHGASLSALVQLAEKYGYTLVETTLFNAFFAQNPLYKNYLQKEVPDTSIEALHEPTMGTSLYQLYDGNLKLWGCKRMLWHRIPVS